MHRILVVDDETVITTQLEEHLAFMGYDVVGSASSGEEAIDIARDLTPDLILMDIVMQPDGLDGIDAAAAIQAEQDTPVIFLTAFADDAYVERARKVQPFGYILKPFQEREIKACIEVALHKKAIERQLQESEERHRSVVETAGEAIVIVDSLGNIVSWNRAAETIFGYTSADATGRPFTRMIPEALRKKLEDEMHQIVATGQSALFENMIEYAGLRKDGAEFPIELSLTTWKAREETFCTIIMADITARKRIEAALAAERASLAEQVKERTAELSQALRLKDEFLATMSHELRTPLNVILGMSEVLLEESHGPLNDRQHGFLCSLEKSGRDLFALLTDVLDFAQIMAGKIDLDIAPTALDSLCQAALQRINQPARQKHLKLSFLLDNDVTTIQADGCRLQQILDKLLDNAVKFTPEGGEIGLEVTGDSEQQVARFTVRDTGIGIAEQDMAKLFQPFVQVDGSLTRAYDGTGIGLALVARLVEMHGSAIAVESDVGKGSRFTVSLPWQASEERGFL